jgi:glutamate synthase domain-containing protein 2/Pyruvate/2-oxoacid:ferredoxin oxidoreductase delta subunit
MSGFSARARRAAARFPVLVPRHVVRSERCVCCGTCIASCPYECHSRKKEDPRLMADPEAGCCRACFACVFDCPRDALRMIEDQDFLKQGDETFPPAVMRSTLDQAATGRIPVSGAGYGGPFDGSGFDGIWTDMSEIVRPTRDGIHGREHISTVVNIGRKLPNLCAVSYDEEGNLVTPIPPTREIALPVLFQSPDLPGVADAPGACLAMALAARVLRSFTAIPASRLCGPLKEHFNHLIVQLDGRELEQHRQMIEWATMVEFRPGTWTENTAAEAKRINPQLLTMFRLQGGPEAVAQAKELAAAGAETLHLAADLKGRMPDGASLLSRLRETHLGLVEAGLRDRVTLLASGGIIAAEHVPKTIILGADAVIVDLPLLVALECNLCGECRKGRACPRCLENVDPQWGAARIINLMLAWRDQLLEILGAMGLRDVRRLRGETGRAIFADAARQDFQKRLSVSAGGGPAGDAGQGPRRAHSDSEHPPGWPAAGPAGNTASNLSRFADGLASFDVLIDRTKCTDCGLCVEACPQGVFSRRDGKLKLDEPRHHLCTGTPCLSGSECCTKICPWQAIRVKPSALARTLGDKRWTAALLQSVWADARGEAPETAEVPAGVSGGGFDRLRWRSQAPSTVQPDEVDLSLDLNRRSSGPRIRIGMPLYGGGMSYGSVSLAVMQGRALAAGRLGTFTSTGEGGYPDELKPYAPQVITQIATGLFGVREETIQRARIVEFKYAQGAKPGLGGHLLGEKNTPAVAAMREAVPGTSLFSPFPFHSVYSVEDHKKHLDWAWSINPDLLVSVKVSTPGDVDMVAVGAYYAGAHIIHLDGGYGGTGAAPDISKKNIAQPIEYGIVQVHDFLVKEGIRDQVTLMASGGVRSAEDVLKAVALGADGCVIGTAELVAIDCVRCCNCERDRGCPIGIATTDPVLSRRLQPAWVAGRIETMYRAWMRRMRRRLAGLGLRSIGELRGRRDLLESLEP